MLDVPLAGEELTTVTLKIPALAKSALLIVAVSCVALTNVVLRELPFHRTVERPLRKPLPVTVRVNPELPTTAETALRLVIAGAAYTVREVLPLLLRKPVAPL